MTAENLTHYSIEFTGIYKNVISIRYKSTYSPIWKELPPITYCRHFFYFAISLLMYLLLYIPLSIGSHIFTFLYIFGMSILDRSRFAPRSHLDCLIIIIVPFHIIALIFWKSLAAKFLAWNLTIQNFPPKTDCNVNF